MRLELEWGRGGRGVVVEHDGNRVVVRSSLPAPPGTPLEGRAEGAPGVYRIKVRSCRREPDGPGDLPFRIEGRFVSLSRALRQHLDPSK